MVRLWQQGGCDSVVAVRHSRTGDSFLKKATAHAFYKVATRLADVPMQPNAGDFRLLDRSVVDALRSLPERTRFMKGLYAWVGTRSAVVDYERPARAAGRSKWSFWRLWNFALDGIFSFSTIPLRIWTYVGATAALLASIYGAIIIVRTMLHGVDVPGYASLLVVVLFMGGLNLIGLGILGEYIGRIFTESKQRPLYLVRDLVPGPPPADDHTERP
jgi:glycosyltransferase involved in cell wall biosynthesis